MTKISPGTISTPPPTPNSPEKMPAALPIAASLRVRRIGGHTRARALRNRPAPGPRPAAEGGPVALGGAARRGRRARPDRAEPGGLAHARDDAAAADRGRQALHRRRLRVGPAGVGRAPDRLARLDRLPRL